MSKRVYTVELYNHPSGLGKVNPARNGMILPPSTRTRGLMAEVNQYGVSDARLVLECDVDDDSPKILIEYLVFRNNEIVPEDVAYVGSYFHHECDECSHTITYCHVYERLHREVDKSSRD